MFALNVIQLDFYTLSYLVYSANNTKVLVWKTLRNFHLESQIVFKEDLLFSFIAQWMTKSLVFIYESRIIVYLKDAKACYFGEHPV